MAHVPVGFPCNLYKMEDDPEDVAGPEVALLSRSTSDITERPIRLHSESNMTRAGTFRAYWLGCVVCMGGFLFGYDSGIIGTYT